ncbi:hypothetical protein CYPRO_0754 [Cyclonatronum proteinivorum]|uniref:Porin n=1 Tax=Cyclonatronum proteinivorum TaxID=1457365 RepID=A0A345UHT5_9BACT|nr:hypothetical protein [Cyclonatronum proteinivorum]AXJ00037.1 hypothetical protein CYPRO_0754 [Cyclonatronum proteinivorum]
MLSRALFFLTFTLALSGLFPLHAQTGQASGSFFGVNSGSAGTSFSPELHFYGAFRPVFTHVETTERDGSSGTVSALNARLHLGSRLDVTPDFWLQTRLAVRVASNQNNFRFIFEDHTPGSGSYPAGTATFDELFAAFNLTPSLHLRAGRFQARYPLAGFIPKGMDRYYGANLSIGHTDGLWLRWDAHRDWRLHGVVSHNGSRGSTHAGRSPMNFQDDAARLSWFFNAEHRNTSGLWVQRELSISHTSNVIPEDGSLQNYTAVTARAMLRLPVQTRSGEFWAGTELGVVPNAPGIETVTPGIRNDRSFITGAAVSWQVSAYANEVLPGHLFGVLYGETEPHWLVSSSFSGNTTMAEFRHRFILSDTLNFEWRIRYRTDLYRPSTSDQSRQIADFYARFTYRF